jgi:hypothetical protein
LFETNKRCIMYFIDTYPEFIDVNCVFRLDISCFEALRRVDMYAVGLVLWELCRRVVSNGIKHLLNLHSFTKNKRNFFKRMMLKNFFNNYYFNEGGYH